MQISAVGLLAFGQLGEAFEQPRIAGDVDFLGRSEPRQRFVERGGIVNLLFGGQSMRIGMAAWFRRTWQCAGNVGISSLAVGREVSQRVACRLLRLRRQLVASLNGP